MPWLPIYADFNDFRTIHDWLNASEELAFLVSDGPNRWRAVRTVPALDPDRVCLWHIPSGALPLLHSHPSLEVSSITDPWRGWQELRTGADASRPYFGAGHPGVIWLNFRPSSGLATTTGSSAMPLTHPRKSFGVPCAAGLRSTPKRFRATGRLTALTPRFLLSRPRSPRLSPA